MALAIAGALAACQRKSPTPAATAEVTPPPRPLPPPPFRGKDAEMAMEALKAAPDHGFAAKRFRTDHIAELVNSADAAQQAEGERQLRAIVVDYARAHRGLTVPAGARPRDWGQKPAAYDAEAELNAAIRAGTLKAWLDDLPSKSPTYQALQAAYVAYLRGEKPPPRPKVAAAPLALGAQDRTTAALRKRLALEFPELIDVPEETPVDEALIASLQRYQAAHGLPPSGYLDDATVKKLNTPLLNPGDALRANMERQRWLPRAEPATRIDVNIASAEMNYFADNQPVTHMLVAAGKKGDETPMLTSAIDSLVLNPPWYVPQRIAREEIVPKGRAYMRSRGFVWRDGRLIQRPGPHTALGLVKFDFPNDYAVYLHDTPSKAAFNRAQRTVSHGCVRLARAVELARTLISQQPGWSAARLDKVLASGRTTRVKLDQPVPVRLMYLTAVPQADQIAYLPDVYGWDTQLLGLLDRYEARKRSA
ncbi:L,D-transpeptidase family protein [Phenylobacterium sp. LjRoot219]|uniref:L,D-transpeptidase family protein n=1 Tax=Phenylobacterium sp. LjRoot219 TaxID=3342283 RepID=UPI003ECFEE23